MRVLTNHLPVCLLLCFGCQYVIAQDTLIHKESTWLYEDDGTNLGTTWKDSGYSAATFVSGQGPLGMGGITGATMQTTITKRVTTYYIKEVNLSAPSYSSIEINIMCDDGFVLYVNGIEAYRENMPTGSITFTTTASTFVSGSDEGDYDNFTINDTLLGNGINTIAVELHNQSVGNSDLAFDMEMIATLASLPVSLLKFSAEVNGPINLLEWATASEINNEGFHIQRSRDASTWETIGFVKGAGNSNQEISYSFIDSETQEGTTYYRLVQQDFDGKQEESEVQSIYRKIAEDNIIIYPNPTKNSISVKTNSEEKYSYSITDSQGKAIQTTPAIGASTFDCSHLRNGSYFLEIISPNRASTTKRFYILR